MTNKRFCWLYFLVPIGFVIVGRVIIDVCHALEMTVDEIAIQAYVSWVGSALLYVLVLRNYHHVMIDNYKDAEKSKTAFLKKVLLFFVILFLAGEIGTWAVNSFSPNAAWSNESLINQFQEKTFAPLFWLEACVFAPVTEEIVFRYILQNGIKSKPWNIVIVSLISGFLHAFFGAEIFVYIAMGLCLGIAYEKTDDINVPICMHVLNNVISLALR